ncbi:AAA family ATPase [Pantoea sp. ME81]|uniref:AAA family ATPase n=1 Tax=Pantoea sp. ME81 TaxID=2743935 RepID=UPI0015F50057|nr:AAA family ATPase [Pantoea sp. ME81]
MSTENSQANSSKTDIHFGRSLEQWSQIESVIALAELNQDYDKFELLGDSMRNARLTFFQAGADNAPSNVTHIRAKSKKTDLESVLDDLPPVPFRPLVENFFETGAHGVIAGEPNAGKSTLAIHLGFCIASGRQFFGQRVKRSHFVYVDLEGSEPLQILKGNELTYNAGKSVAERFHVIEQCPDFGDLSKVDAFCDSVKSLAGGEQIGAIVFDTLRMVMAASTRGGDKMAENDNTDMGYLALVMRYIARRCDTACIMIHHPNKADPFSLAGGGALGGSIRFGLNVSVPDKANRSELNATITKKRGAGICTGTRWGYRMKSVQVVPNSEIAAHHKEMNEWFDECLPCATELREGDQRYELPSNPQTHAAVIESIALAPFEQVDEKKAALDGVNQQRKEQRDAKLDHALNIVREEGEIMSSALKKRLEDEGLPERTAVRVIASLRDSGEVALPGYEPGQKTAYLIRVKHPSPGRAMWQSISEGD